MHQLSDKMTNCLNACETCRRVCAETFSHCLAEGGKHAEPQHLRLLLDCVDACRASAEFLVRGSELHHLTCGTCAAVCERCAEDCERVDGDEQMRKCAAACRACARSCSEMSEGRRAA
ncbi:MAG: four-helix bundle copper-binding protein [Gemmataceae bacterium]|jgi:hypothetical protein